MIKKILFTNRFYNFLFVANIVCVGLFFLILFLIFTVGIGKNVEDWKYIIWSVITFNFNRGIEASLDDWAYVSWAVKILNWLGVINIVSIFFYLIKRRPKEFHKQLVVLWTIIFSVLYFMLGYLIYGKYFFQIFF